MHAMGPNVAGVIGTAIAAGVFIATYAEAAEKVISGVIHWQQAVVSFQYPTFVWYETIRL